MFKTNVFYVCHNTFTNEVFTESMYRHRIDTYDYMVMTFGDGWEESHPYLAIKLCEVIIRE